MQKVTIKLGISVSSSDFNLVPLLTGRDEITPIEGGLSNFTTNSTKTYAFAGISDGLGVHNDGCYNSGKG